MIFCFFEFFRNLFAFPQPIGSGKKGKKNCNDYNSWPALRTSDIFLRDNSVLGSCALPAPFLRLTIHIPLI
jgi:hypothetical protein